MDLELVNLAGFELKGQEVVKDDGESQVTRAEFNRGLVIITEVSRESQQVRLHSNFDWKRGENGKWVPDVENENPNFHDVSK